MPIDRRRQVIDALRAADGTWGAPETLASRLCDFCLERVRARGVAVSVVSNHDVVAVIASSGDLVDDFVEAQSRRQSGPSIEAARSGVAVLEPDLAGRGLLRWPRLVPDPAAARVAGAYAFPLAYGAVSVGMLDLVTGHGDRALSADQVALALTVSEVALEGLLWLQSGRGNGDLSPTIASAGEQSWVIHQAAGMVSVQLDVEVTNALQRLRDEASARRRTVGDLAEAVVSRQFTFVDSDA
jgi:hypothetical protein